MISENYSELFAFLDRCGIKYLKDEPMSEHTSFRIGGKAKAFVMPRDADELKGVYQAASKLGIKSYILGKGTNVLFDDAGFDGVVISTLSLDFVKQDGERLICGAGASLTSTSRFALDKSLEGLSFAYGIPGSVGGGVYMNAGAYNGEVSFVLESSEYLDLEDGEIHKLSSEDHDFAYRYSSYKEHPERVILSATFRLRPGEYDRIKAEMDDFINRRRTKQPLEFPSAGSVFKRYPGRYTAQMIDEVGLKGASVGGAEVSEKHAGFIVNKGGATSSDVLCLIDLIKNTIRDKYGIDIECEIIHVGGDNDGK